MSKSSENLLKKFLAYPCRNPSFHSKAILRKREEKFIEQRKNFSSCQLPPMSIKEATILLVVVSNYQAAASSSPAPNKEKCGKRWTTTITSEQEKKTGRETKATRFYFLIPNSNKKHIIMSMTQTRHIHVHINGKRSFFIRTNTSKIGKCTEVNKIKTLLLCGFIDFCWSFNHVQTILPSYECFLLLCSMNEFILMYENII